MRNMIRADLRRIFRKPAFYIIIVIGMLFLIFQTKSDTSSDQIEALKSTLGGVILFAASIPAFLAIYGDDINSGFMINLIGSGYSRKKVIRAKLCDAAIILTAVYAVAYVIALIKNMTAGLSITPRQNLFLLFYCIFTVIRGVAFFAFASLVVFATWNSALGMVAMLFEIVFLKLILNAVQSKFTIPFYDLSIGGMLDASFAKFSVGEFGWQIIPAILIYICAVVFVTGLIFKRKELDL